MQHPLQSPQAVKKKPLLLGSRPEKSHLEAAVPETNEVSHFGFMFDVLSMNISI